MVTPAGITGALGIGLKIWEAVKALFDAKDRLAKAKKERRADIAALLDHIAAALEITATELRNGNYPHNKCAEIAGYARDLPGKLRDELGGQADTIGQALEDAHAVELIHAERNTPDGREAIAKIEEAAGMLRAIGKMLPLG